VLRQVKKRKRLVFVQVIENTGLVRAQELARFRVTDVPGMAGEVDARVQLHHLLHGILGHSGEILNHYFDLSNQINLGHSSFVRREN